MTSTTSTRRPQPTRTVRVTPEGIMSIRVGRLVTLYWLDRVAEFSTDESSDFYVEEFGGRSPQFVVTVAKGYKPTCDCVGWKKNGKCVHGDAVAALVKMGRV